MVRHDVRVDDARQTGRDSFNVSLHGSALPGTFENSLGLSRRFRTVAGASRVAVELRQLMLRAAMRGDERPRRMIPARSKSNLPRRPGNWLDFSTASDAVSWRL